MFEVTRTFKDIDKRTIKVGTKASLLVRQGKVKEKDPRYYWNLIDGDTVIAVTIGQPPVKVINNVRKVPKTLRDPTT
jgi:hypothetical protein